MSGPVVVFTVKERTKLSELSMENRDDRGRQDRNRPKKRALGSLQSGDLRDGRVPAWAGEDWQFHQRDRRQTIGGLPHPWLSTRLSTRTRKRYCMILVGKAVVEKILIPCEEIWTKSRSCSIISIILQPQLRPRRLGDMSRENLYTQSALGSLPKRSWVIVSVCRRSALLSRRRAACCAQQLQRTTVPWQSRSPLSRVCDTFFL
eukprot:g30262.t1